MSKVSVITKATPSNIGGLVTFLTVARASANRMLDAPLGMVSTWVDGQPLYSSSFGGANWHWQADFPAATATDNETTCRPTSWVAGGLNGAAVRSLSGNPIALTQTTWKVDSTAADNEGAGSVLDPLKTDIEINRRYGVGIRGRLGQATVVTYAQAPTNVTNYLIEFSDNASFTLVGTPTVSKSGTIITAVQAQVRTPGAELGWAVTGVGLGAADVNKLVFITAGTAANIGAYAMVLADLGGGKLAVSPFGKTTIGVVSFAQITPVVGDTVEIRDPMSLTIGCIECHPVTNDQLVATEGFFATDSIRVVGNSANGAGSLFNGGLSFQYHKSILKDVSLCGTGLGGFLSHQLLGGGVATSNLIIQRGTFATLRQTGCLGGVLLGQGASATIQADTYFYNSGLTVARVQTVNTQGAAFFNRAVADSALAVSAGGFCFHTGSVADWGTGNAGHGTSIFSAGSYVYATKPTINSGLGAGREARIGGTDKLYAAVPYIEGANNAALVQNA